MTASQLRQLFARTQGDIEYDGGRRNWRVTSQRGDVHLTLTSGCGWTVVKDLSDEDVDDLMLALMQAQASRERYRSSTGRKAA